jgi:hypothetical protein
MDIILNTIDGETEETTLEAFLADNPDMDGEEVADICGTLGDGGIYRGGGGAAPLWSVELPERLHGTSSAAATIEDLEAKLAHDEREAAHRANLEKTRQRSAAFGTWYMETIPAALQPAVEPWSRLLRDAFEAGAKASR